MHEPKIFPQPAELILPGGGLPLPEAITLEVTESVNREFTRRGIVWEALLAPCGVAAKGASGKTLPLRIQTSAGLPAEGYTLCATPEAVEVVCGDAPGAYYALLTLNQVLAWAEDGEIPCLQVRDRPALALRGVLLDIGRDKIPTLKSLLLLVDRLAAMKINHLQLYMDGYCFEWQKYKYLFPDETPITAEEIRQLAGYCAARFIDLVPCMNSLGHMGHWLAKPQFRGFAECEQGYDFQGLYHREPDTINPGDKRAVEWVQSLFDELLVNFDSGYINANLDEPFELGQGKNAALAAEKGPHAPYLPHVREMHRYCSERGKRMLMWGDVLLDDPSLMDQLPRDVTVLHWMYEGEGRFGPAAETLAKSGLDFVLCPGTSCWCAFTGRSDSMRANVADAVQNALRYGAKGILITDWGDLGHWQYHSASLVPFAFAAGMAWAGEKQTDTDIFAYCDRAIFKDESGRAAACFYELGNYYKHEHAPVYSTTLCAGVMTSKHRFANREDFPRAIELMLKLCRNLADWMEIKIPHPDIRLDAPALQAHLKAHRETLAGLRLGCPDGGLILAEMQNACRFTLHGMRLYQAMSHPDAPDFTEQMGALYQDLDELLAEHFRLWVARNRPGGFGRSSEQLLHLLDVYRKEQKAGQPAS